MDKWCEGPVQTSSSAKADPCWRFGAIGVVVLLLLASCGGGTSSAAATTSSTLAEPASAGSSSATSVNAPPETMASSGPAASVAYEAGTLAVYDVVDGKRGAATLVEDVTGANVEQYEQVWALFAELIPERHRRMVVSFTVFSDGPDGVPAQMISVGEQQREWRLLFNLDFGYVDGVFQEFDTAYILLHEFGHALTLHIDQFESVLPRAAASAEEVEDCDAYYIEEGCLSASSYLGTYFTNFWSELYVERQAIPIDEGTAFSGTDDPFYDRFGDEFVTAYASTSPAEDIAESWTWFVIYDRPEADSTVIDRKVLHFYDYSELVSLRTHAQAAIPLDD